MPSRPYGDPVDVWTGGDGHPARFVWRDRLFVVHRVLEHWVASRDPCGEARGDDPDPVRREFWRVEAGPARDLGVYELRLDPATATWQLSRAWAS